MYAQPTTKYLQRASRTGTGGNGHTVKNSCVRNNIAVNHCCCASASQSKKWKKLTKKNVRSIESSLPTLGFEFRTMQT